MKGKDIVIELGNISQKYYEEAEKDTIPAGRNHKTLKRPFLIAAIVAMLLMLVGCAVIYALRLQDLKLGEFIHTYPRYIDANGEKVYETEVKLDVISLQGIAGSPEFLAAQEWDAFYQSIPYEDILDDFRAPENYDAYSIYNQEMLDKVDALSDKYNLKLCGPIALCQSYEQDIFFESLGLTSLLKPKVNAVLEDGSGYFYANGNFQLEFWLTLIGEDTPWPYDILMSYNLKHKGYFDTVIATMEDVNAANQWNYTLSDGTDVLIVKSGTIARIFCDRADAFVSVGFSILDESGSGNAVMTDRDVEVIAETLDFTAKPQTPDMDAVKAKLEESQKKHLEEEKAKMETWVNPFVHDYENYSDVIAYLLENSSHPENIYYGLWDLTGDGEAELLIGCADSFGSAKTIVDGEVTTLISNGTDSGYVLCKDRVFLYQNGDNYYFNRVDTINLENLDYCIDILEFDPWDEVWSRTKDGVTESMSEEEAAAIIEGYGPFDVGMKPISQYPMDK